MVQDPNREKIAEALLESIGRDLAQLQLLGQGAYNTVYKGLHPDQSANPGVVIAFKVVSGPKEKVENEKLKATEIQKLQPKDWSSQKEKFDAFARALCGPAAKVSPDILKQAKYGSAKSIAVDKKGNLIPR